MPLLYRCCWFLQLFVLMHACLAMGSSLPRGKHRVVHAHDGFHNINREPKYKNWKARQEQHAKHYYLISQTIINN